MRVTEERRGVVAKKQTLCSVWAKDVGRASQDVGWTAPGRAELPG